MKGPVLVRGFSDNWWFLFARILSFIGLSVGTYRFANQQPHGQLLLILGGIALAVVESVAAYGRRRQLWIEDLGHGFRVIDPRGRREIIDQQVAAASIETREHFHEGLIRSITQRLNLWIDSDPQPLIMTARITVAEPNPLGELWTRLFEGLKARAESSFEKGETIAGAGWRLRRDGFELETRGAHVQIRLEDFTAIHVIRQHLCLWTSADRPTVHIPIHSRNAQILRLLLEPKVQQRPKSDAPGGDGLGRILYEHRTSAGKLMGLALLALAIGGFGVYLVCSLGHSVFGWVVLTSGGLLALSLLQNFSTYFRWHQYGIAQRGLGGVRQLRYAEVGKFQWSMSQFYYKGSFSHIDYRFEFHPHPDSTSQPILFSPSVRNASDDGLSQWIDHVDELIGRRPS